MAGAYPDAVSNRLAYDVDGTIFFHYDGSNVYQASSAEMLIMNDETRGPNTGTYAQGFGVASVYQGLIFPRRMNIDAMFLSTNGYNTGYANNFVYSLNTTTGIDGTWTAMPSPPTPGVGLFAYGGFDYASALSPQYRTAVKTGLGLTNVKAIRWNGANGGYGFAIQAFHVYGTPNVSAVDDRLELWHPTLDQRIPPAYFDFGDVPRGTTTDKLFRVKNRSDTLTANNVVLSIQTPTDTGPSVAGMHYFSVDAGPFASTATISTIYPGATSSVVTLRQIVPAGAQLSIWASRIKAQPTTWT